jgi:hypothetical protein
MTLGSALQIGKHTSFTWKLFSALATNGLASNLEKCVFAVPTLEILSHMILAVESAYTAEHTVAMVP